MMMTTLLFCRFPKFFLWLMKKYKSETKLAVHSIIKIIGINKIFLSTSLITVEDPSLESNLYWVL